MCTMGVILLYVCPNTVRCPGAMMLDTLDGHMGIVCKGGS